MMQFVVIGINIQLVEEKKKTDFIYITLRSTDNEYAHI